MNRNEPFYACPPFRQGRGVSTSPRDHVAFGSEKRPLEREKRLTQIGHPPKSLCRAELRQLSDYFGLGVRIHRNTHDADARSVLLSPAQSLPRNGGQSEALPNSNSLYLLQ